MIIQCEQCKTRFKVGDDKLQAGAIRVRCSKCNHVFLAQADAAQSTAALGSPAGVTGLFASVNVSAPPAPSSGGGFGSAQNRSGIFRAPTLGGGMPAVGGTPSGPSADPFANLGPRVPPPTADPFAGLQAKPPVGAPPAPPADPFAGLAAKQPPSASPFAALGDTRAPGPVTAMSMPAFNLTPAASPPPPPPPPAPLPRGATPSPFAPSFASPAPDPFAASSSEVLTSPALPRAPTPSRTTESMSVDELRSMSGAAVADPFGAQATKRDAFQAAQGAVSDPFASVASAPPAPNTDPFGVAQPLRTDGGLFSPEPSAASDPFGLSASAADATSGAPPAPSANPFADPFAAMPGAPSSGASNASVPPPPPPSEEGDPFAGIDADVESRALFDMPTQPPAPAPAHTSAPPAPATSEPPRPTTSVSTAPTHAPATGADMKRLRRLELAQRTREIAWGVTQVVILFLLVTVAVVIGRGGSLPALLRGDVVAALGGASSEGTLSVSDVRVARRVHKNGAAIVIITGSVHNRGLDSVPGARVDVRFDGDTRTASGWAWSDVDGLEIEDVADAPDAAQLSTRSPKSSALAPGERAPFVVVGPAPAEGARALIDVVAVKPPPPPAPVVEEPAPGAPTGAAAPGSNKPGAVKAGAAKQPTAPATSTTTPTGAKPAVAKPAAGAKALGVKPAAPGALKPKAPAKP